MKNKLILLILILVFAGLLAEASVLYNRLSQDAPAQQLQGAPETASTSPTSPTSPTAATAPTETQPGEQPQAEPTHPLIMAPDFTVYDRDGNPGHLSDYFGKPIVLNFWASFCQPCQWEMPHFHDKHLELEDEVHFLMINLTADRRETVERGAAYIDKNGFTFPVYYDVTGQAQNTYGVSSYPTTFFINAQGQLVTWAPGVLSPEMLEMGLGMIH